MSILSDLSQYCDPSTLNRGKELITQDGLYGVQTERDDAGKQYVKAKCLDSFHFVDHPSLIVDPVGEKLLSYLCDCPDSRRGDFCFHCAALALTLAEQTEDSGTQLQLGKRRSSKKEPEPEATGEILQYSFRFANSRSGLYPELAPNEDPEIPMDRFVELFGNTQRALVLYIEEAFGGWGGSCFGMAAANSIFNWVAAGPRTTDFQDDADIPWKLPLKSVHADWDMDLHRFIDLLYLTQMHPYARCHALPRMQPPDEFLRDLCRVVSDCASGLNPLCIIGVIGPCKERDRDGNVVMSMAGHALLPYRVDICSPELMRLALYDCNYPGEERYLYLDLDEEDRIVNWRYEMSDDIGTWSGDQKKCKLEYFDSDSVFEIFDKRPMPEEDPKGMLFSSAQMCIRNSAGEEMLRIADGEYTAAGSGVSVVRPISMKPKKPIVRMPSGAYLVTVEEPEETDIQLTFTVENRSVTLTSSARSFAFWANDEMQTCGVSIPEAGRSYSVRLNSTDKEDFPNVRLEGVTGPQGLRLAQIRHALYAEGIVDQEKQTLYLNDAFAPLSLLQTRFPEQQREETEREVLLNSAGDKEEGPAD